MATTIAETDIRGRLGTYTLTIYDTSEAAATIDPFEVEEGVSIVWGEQGRDYPEQILKSYLRISVRQGASDISSLFFGNFDPTQYPVRVVGEGVDWIGFVQPEERSEPFSSRVERENPTLLISDGFNLADTDASGSGRNAFAEDIKLYFELGPVTADGLSFTDTHEVRFDGTYQAIDGTRYDASTNLETTDVHIGMADAIFGFNPYRGVIAFLRQQRARLYRGLSTGSIRSHSLRETGASLEYVTVDTIGGLSAGSITTTTPAQDIERITQTKAIGPFRENFQTLRAAGDIDVDLTDFSPPGGPGIGELDVGDYNLMRGGASEIIDAGGGPTQILDEASSRARPGYELGGSGADPATIECRIGEIDPVTDLGLLVEWSVVDAGGGAMQVEIDYGTGYTDPVATEADGITNTSLEGPIDDDVKDDIRVRFTGYDVTVSPIGRWVTTTQVIETLNVEREDRALETVDLDFGTPTAFVSIAPISTPLRYFPGVDTSGTGDGSSAIGLDAVQPWQTRAFLEREYRPIGAFSLQVELAGLYGPETGLVITKPDGTDGFFVVGTGCECNLATGTTRASLVEVPEALLPGGAIPSV